MQTLIPIESSLSQPNLSDPKILLATLQDLRQTVYREGQAIFQEWRPLIKRRSFLINAINLAYYLALRRHDLRSLQTALIPWGLSSLGRSESRVLPNLDAVICTLSAVCQVNSAGLPKRPPMRAFLRGDRFLQREADTVFGQISPHRHVRIMVTLPSEAADNYALVKSLLQCGTDCVRINCAHDAPPVWQAMIGQLRRAEAETGKQCKIFMDLGGPKTRTGQVVAPKERIFAGDRLLLTRNSPETADPSVRFRASCTLPEVLTQLRVGAAVWIDDGHIGTRVASLTSEGVLLEVTYTRPKGEKLRPDKGLNFPDTVLHLSPLTAKDLQDLDFVATHADIIGYSFVQTGADVALLQRELQKRLPTRWRNLAIVAKLETNEAIRNLPETIVQAAGQQPFGLMIARGDLAVEISYQRLAEMQEEILWLCEAAHIPVIWATQVLESLAKNGIPSRAEITDAAMAERAECVMLNKGPFITQAVTILDDVLTRMQDHQCKKTPQLRALHSW